MIKKILFYFIFIFNNLRDLKLKKKTSVNILIEIK